MKLQVTVEGKTYEVEVEILEEDEGARPPGLGSYEPAALPAPIASPGSQFSGGGSWPEANGAKVCRSPITGLVIRVNVEPGQAVQANDLLLVLEAMKMENSVTARATATVKSVCVVPGDSVKVGQVVIEFD
ncbi:MAG: acetyl-CoA carboxylase biotin carboxyl carrier protein subunit [Terracidiphilus sp.]|nr:acetyl-CoA carboxylase biotin carboxyl carrier protein subunit [Terracidiphilus sp.]